MSTHDDPEIPDTATAAMVAELLASLRPQADRFARRDDLAAHMPATVGLTVTHSGGYSPVCLKCGRRLRVVVARRSAALTLLDDHELTSHQEAAA